MSYTLGAVISQSVSDEQPGNAGQSNEPVQSELEEAQFFERQVSPGLASQIEPPSFTNPVTGQLYEDPDWPSSDQSSGSNQSSGSDQSSGSEQSSGSDQPSSPGYSLHDNGPKFGGNFEDEGSSQHEFPGSNEPDPPPPPPEPSKMNIYFMIAGAALLILLLTKKDK